MKTVYNFDSDGWFLSVTTLNESDISPLEEGVYLIPGNCTEIEPPASNGNWFPKFNRGTQNWTLVDKVTENSTEGPEPTIEELKTITQQKVTEYRWQKETGGITVGESVISTGIEDQNRITSVIANAELAGATELDFKAANGWVTLTLEQVKGIATAIALHVQMCFTKERAISEVIDSLETVEEIEHFDIATMWDSF